MTDPRTPGKELLACPFCGGRHIVTASGQAEFEDEPDWAAVCAGCHAEVRGDSEADAIALWNTRPEPPMVPSGFVEEGVVERLTVARAHADSGDDWNAINDALAALQQVQPLGGIDRDALCRIIETHAPVRDDFTGIPIGSHVEALADRIAAAIRQLDVQPAAKDAPG